MRSTTSFLCEVRSPTVDPGWLSLGAALPYLAHVPGFGSSAADASHSRPRAHTVYIDLNGARGNGTGGPGVANARGTLPTTWVTDTKYLFTNTSELSWDFVAQGPTIIEIGVASVTLSVCDSATGDEIVDQPNPFERARTGGWVTDAEKQSKYFRLHGNSNVTNHDGVNRRAIHVTGNDVLIRGAFIEGCHFGVVAAGSTITGFRVEDCVLSECWTQTTGASSQEPGGCIRFETGIGVAQPAVACRCFVNRPGNDGIWAGVGAGHQFIELAVRGIGYKIMAGSFHADGIQVNSDTTCTLRRSIVDSTLVDRVLLDSGNGETWPRGSSFILAGSGPLNSVGRGPVVVEDCILTSNDSCYNSTSSMPPGSTLTRTLFYKGPPQISPPKGSTRAVTLGAMHTLLDCAVVYHGASAYGGTLYAGTEVSTGSVRTNVFELLD